MAIKNTPAQDYVQSDYSNAGRLKANASSQEQKFIEIETTCKRPEFLGVQEANGLLA